MEGGAVGKYYLVYSDGDDNIDYNGVFVGSNKGPLAVLVTRGVSTTESFCEVALPSKEWVIQPGDRVMPISKAAANHLRFATYNSTPNAPRISGYNGRWRRIAPVVNPYSVIVRYDSWWSLPGLPPAIPPAPPGYYYVDVPRAAFVATDAYSVPRAPRIAPGSWSSQPVTPTQAPAAYPPAASPPIQPMYPSSYPNYRGQYDFDVNQITDARLIRTFHLLTDIEKYALEIQHRGAWGLYSTKFYREALDSFSQQAYEYNGNYLSAYWAGRSAQQLGNLHIASSWYDRALQINPYFQPAKNSLSEISKQLGGESKKQTKRK
jgi:hypothetical protein